MTALEETFLEVVCDAGSPVRDCACGKVHFDADGQDMDPGELEGLEVKQRAEPEKYVSQAGTVYFGYFAGECLVYGCECGRARALATTFWQNRHKIAAFLGKVATMQIRDGQDVLNTLPAEE